MRALGFKQDSRSGMFKSTRGWDSVPFNQVEQYLSDKSWEEQQESQPAQPEKSQETQKFPSSHLEELAGGDVHLLRGLKAVRDHGKSLNHGQGYRMGAEKLQQIFNPFSSMQQAESSSSMSISERIDARYGSHTDVSTETLGGLYVEVFEADEHERLINQLNFEESLPEFEERVREIKKVADLHKQLLRMRLFLATKHNQLREEARDQDTDGKDLGGAGEKAGVCTGEW